MNRTLKQAQADAVAPWHEALVVTRDYSVFRDAYPVTEGHVLFVPQKEDWQHVTKCWEAAYRWGIDWVDRGYCEAFNMGMNVGEAAGQTIKYPHIHLIPRRTGDMTDPRGGVRHVIPTKGNYNTENLGKSLTCAVSVTGLSQDLM